MSKTKIILIVIGITFLLAISGVLMKSCNIFKKHAYKSMENAVISYDEFQDIYNTCKQIDADLLVIKETPESDKQFEQFSKSQRINALKQNLNRWIGEYNSKTKHIDKGLWKSKELPQTLSTTDFINY